MSRPKWGKRMQQLNGCVLCLDWTGKHRAANCTMWDNPNFCGRCHIKEGGNEWTRFHHTLIHGSGRDHGPRRVQHQVHDKGRRGEAWGTEPVWRSCFGDYVRNQDWCYPDAPQGQLISKTTEVKDGKCSDSRNSALDKEGAADQEDHAVPSACYLWPIGAAFSDNDKIQAGAAENHRGILREMVEASEVEFQRYVMPKGVETKTMMLHEFSDGGDPASSRLYLCKNLKEGTWRPRRNPWGAVTCQQGLSDAFCNEEFKEKEIDTMDRADGNADPNKGDNCHTTQLPKVVPAGHYLPTYWQQVHYHSAGHRGQSLRAKQSKPNQTKPIKPNHINSKQTITNQTKPLKTKASHNVMVLWPKEQLCCIKLPTIFRPYSPMNFRKRQNYRLFLRTPSVFAKYFWKIAIFPPFLWLSLTI